MQGDVAEHPKVTAMGMCLLLSWPSDNQLLIVWAASKLGSSAPTETPAVTKSFHRIPVRLNFSAWILSFSTERQSALRSFGSNFLVFLLYYSFFSRRKYVNR